MVVETDRFADRGIDQLLPCRVSPRFQQGQRRFFPEETLGLLKFKDRESAKRTLEWVKSRVQKEHTGKFPIFESSIDELPDGRFQIDAFKTDKNGESNRVC
jgi:hypothetical protein